VKDDVPIVEKDSHAWGDFARQRRIVDSRETLGRLDRSSREDEWRPFLQCEPFWRQRTHSDLGALKVCENANGARTLEPSDGVDASCVIRLGAV
jgi:hypothetical protein